MFVVTSHAVKCDTGISIGYNLNEAAHPLVKLQAAGIAVEFTPINGGEPPLDGLEDMNDPIIARYWADQDFRQAMAHTKAIAEINPSDYSAIFFAGGHGTMWDFPDNAMCTVRFVKFMKMAALSQRFAMARQPWLTPD